MALEAQCLEVLGLCGEGLVHGDDVVQLARGCGDGGRAELALVVREQGLPRSGRIAAGLEKVKEDLARGARQTLASSRPGTWPAPRSARTSRRCGRICRRRRGRSSS